MSRRNFGLAALATPALLGVTAYPVAAATHSAHPAQLYGADLGRYRITSLFDGLVPLSKEMFFGPAPAEIEATLNANGLTGDALPVPLNSFLLQSEDRTILVDAGLGSLDIFGPGFGRAFDALESLSVAPSDIDTVVLTHAHPDHIAGIIGPDGAVFGNAQVFVTETELGFWTDAGMMAQAPAEAQGMFQLAQNALAAYGDRVTPVQDGAEVAPGLTLQLSPGHTPGHAHL
ncbi:MAG: MBL fold metallo-hydrolase, partial [Pseudomonadota bacterium]